MRGIEALPSTAPAEATLTPIATTEATLTTLPITETAAVTTTEPTLTPVTLTTRATAITRTTFATEATLTADGPSATITMGVALFNAPGVAGSVTYTTTRAAIGRTIIPPRQPIAATLAA